MRGSGIGIRIGRIPKTKRAELASPLHCPPHQPSAGICFAFCVYLLDSKAGFCLHSTCSGSLLFTSCRDIARDDNLQNLHLHLLLGGQERAESSNQSKFIPPNSHLCLPGKGKDY